MRHITSTLLVLLCAPHALAQVAATPELSLPADAVVYFRYDGYESHRKAYDQTAVAKVMKEGLGEFFGHVIESMARAIQNDSLAHHAPWLKDERKKKVRPAAPLNEFLDGIGRHGFVLALELAPRHPRLARPVSFLTGIQLTVVFPQGADPKQKAVLEGLFRSAAEGLGSTVEDTEYLGQKVAVVSLGDIQATWWPKGQDMIFTVGHQNPQWALRVLDGRRANITETAWFPKLAQFKRYESDMRGYIDISRIVEHLAGMGLEPPAFGNLKDRLARMLLLRHLGLTGLKDFTFHLGFDGKYQRSTLCLGVVEPAQRRGLLNLGASAIDFDPDNLPPLPPDADYVSMRCLDWSACFDFIRTSFGLSALQSVFQGQLPDRFPDVDRIVGGDFRKDFLDLLDTNVVSFGAHSEGPFLLGQGFAVKVKDAAKVRKALAGIAEALGALDERLVVDDKKYRDAELHVFSNCYLPLTYAVHKDWLVFGLFPQPVQGFVMRSGGGYRTWKAPPELHEVLAKERRDQTGGKLLTVCVSDPRPAMSMALTFLPLLFQYANTAFGSNIFDVSKVPNTQSVNEWLFPNVTLLYDDGNALRWENHYSITEPDHIALGLILSGVGSQLVDLGLSREPVAIKSANRLRDGTVLTKASAAEKDGVITISVKVPIQVTEQVPRTVVETVFKLDANGKSVPHEVQRTVYETITKEVEETRTFVADGKTVLVTRKNMEPVDPKDLLKLLAKESAVVFVPAGVPLNLDAFRLHDDELIISVIDPPPENLPAPRPMPENKNDGR